MEADESRLFELQQAHVRLLRDFVRFGFGAESGRQETDKHAVVLTEEMLDQRRPRRVCFRRKRIKGLRDVFGHYGACYPVVSIYAGAVLDELGTEFGNRERPRGLPLSNPFPRRCDGTPPKNVPL